jgi:hypothetical protein
MALHHRTRCSLSRAVGEVVRGEEGSWQDGAGHPGCTRKVSNRSVFASDTPRAATDGSDHPALLCTRVYTDDFHWIHGSSPVGDDEEPREADIQIRHRMKTVKGRVFKSSTGRTGQG